MSATVESAVLPEVDEVDEQLPAHVARKASGVPVGVGACTGGTDDDVAARHSLVTLKSKYEVKSRLRSAINGRDIKYKYIRTIY